MEYHINELRPNKGCCFCDKPCQFNGHSIAPSSSLALDKKATIDEMKNFTKYACNTFTDNRNTGGL